MNEETIKATTNEETTKGETNAEITKPVTNEEPISGERTNGTVTCPTEPTRAKLTTVTTMRGC